MGSGALVNCGPANHHKSGLIAPHPLGRRLLGDLEVGRGQLQDQTLFKHSSI